MEIEQQTQTEEQKGTAPPLSKSKGKKTPSEENHLYFGNRRSFLGRMAWFSFFSYFLLFVLGSVRGLLNRVTFEPSKKFKAGFPGEFTPGTVDETFLPSQKVRIIRTEEGFLALSSICTHLGCTPRWLKTDNKFKCPCHGSGFFGFMKDQKEIGINFEGPAPRPLERFEISIDKDGQLVVDKSKVYKFELGDWDKPGSFFSYKS